MIREKIKALRAEATKLERNAADEEKLEAYIAALRRERAGVEQRRAAGLKLGDRHERIPSPFKRGEYLDGELSGYEAALQCERQLDDIDVEIKRVSKEG